MSLIPHVLQMKDLLSLDPEEDQALSVCLSGTCLGTLSYQECALLNFSSAKPESEGYKSLSHAKAKPKRFNFINSRELFLA